MPHQKRQAKASPCWRNVIQAELSLYQPAGMQVVSSLPWDYPDVHVGVGISFFSRMVFEEVELMLESVHRFSKLSSNDGVKAHFLAFPLPGGKPWYVPVK